MLMASSSAVGRVAISDAGIIDSRSAGTAKAGYYLNNDGTAQVYRTTTNFVSRPGEWWDGGGAPSGTWEVRATLVSGGLASGTTGTWLSLSSDRSWYVQRTGSGVQQCAMTVEIRPTGGAVVANAAVSLMAEVESGGSIPT